MSMNKYLLWVARILGAASCAFFLSFFVGEGLADLMHGVPPPAELLHFLPLLLVAVAGYAAAWFAAPAGGIMLAAGGAAMLLYHLAHGDAAMALVYGLPFIITGLLFILHRKLK
jgi:hypothetical protein